MGYRLVLDENVEHEVRDRLESYGHDTVHVDEVPELGKGVDDHPIARNSLDAERVIVTYDDDFVLDVAESEFYAVLYFADATLPAETVAAVGDEVSRQYPRDRLDGLEYVGPKWL